MEMEVVDFREYLKLYHFRLYVELVTMHRGDVMVAAVVKAVDAYCEYKEKLK